MCPPVVIRAGIFFDGAKWGEAMKTRIFLLLLALMGGVCSAADLTAADSVVYRGAYEATPYNVVFYRSAQGEYMRRLERRDDGAAETETRYANLPAFRAALLGVDDHAGIMGSTAWGSDADGDGYSDMLEYLTNGDPYMQSTVPTEPRFLYFDGGATFVPLLPLADMEPGGGTDPEPDADVSALAALLERQGERLDALLAVLCYGVGLMMWRLAVLSKSQRSIL